MEYNVCEIFHSIEGEGVRAGALASFVRLAGCNLNCSYCDTQYAMDGTYNVMSTIQILENLNKSHMRRVTLTGGEPLIANGIEALVCELVRGGYEVNIETNGSVDISIITNYLRSRRYEPIKGLIFTMDYKLPSSGETDKMLSSNFAKLRPWDVLKFVVGSDDDAMHMLEVLREIPTRAQVYVGAVYGKFELQKLAKLMIDNFELKDARMQLQLHKIIWDPNERGV